MNPDIRCTGCGASGPKLVSRVASLAGGIMGDEQVDTLYRCAACGAYTVEAYVDRFGGEERARLDGPIARERGEALAALFARCETPWDKTCRCPAHREHFGDSLD